MRRHPATQNRPPSNEACSAAVAEGINGQQYDLPKGCTIGGNCYAVGVHAGQKKSFTAVLLGVRKRLPPFLVKYLCDEAGRRTSLYLPDVKKTYVMAHDVQPWLPREGPTPCSAKTRAQRMNQKDEQAAAESAARKRPRKRTGKRVTFADLPPPFRPGSPCQFSQAETSEVSDIGPHDLSNSVSSVDGASDATPRVTGAEAEVNDRTESVHVECIYVDSANHTACSRVSSSIERKPTARAHFSSDTNVSLRFDLHEFPLLSLLISVVECNCASLLLRRLEVSSNFLLVVLTD